MWQEHEGGKNLSKRFAELYSTPASNKSFWNPPPGNPGGAKNLFDGTIYVRGGDDPGGAAGGGRDADVLPILKDWTRDHAYGNAGTKGFIKLAEADSGMDLGHFFDGSAVQGGQAEELGELSAPVEDHVAARGADATSSAAPAHLRAVGQLRLSPPAPRAAP